MPETATTTEAQGSIAESRQKIQEYPTRTKPFHLPDNNTPEQFAQFIQLKNDGMLKDRVRWFLGKVTEGEEVPALPVRQVDLPADRSDLYTPPSNDFPLGRVKRLEAYKYVLEKHAASMQNLTVDFADRQLPEADPALRQMLLELVLNTTPMMSQAEVNRLLSYLDGGDLDSPKGIQNCSNEELRARIQAVESQLQILGQSSNRKEQSHRQERLIRAMQAFRTATRQTAEMVDSYHSTRFAIRTPTAQEKIHKGEVHSIFPEGFRETEGMATLVMGAAVLSEERHHSSRYVYASHVGNEYKFFSKSLQAPSPEQFLQLRQPRVTVYHGYRRSEKYSVPSFEREEAIEEHVGPHAAYEAAFDVIGAAYLAVGIYEAMSLRYQFADAKALRSRGKKLRSVLREKTTSAWGERDRLVGQVIAVKRSLSSQLSVQLRLPLLQYIASDLDPRHLDVAAWSVSMPSGTVTLRELVQKSMVENLDILDDPDVSMSKEDREYYMAVRQLSQRLLQYFDQVSESIQRAVGEISGESVSREMQDVIHQLFPEGNADHSRIVKVCDRLGVTDWSSGVVADIASALLIARAHGQPATLDNLTKEQLIEARLHPIFTGSTGDVRQSQYGVMLQNHDAQISLEDITSGTQAVSPPEWDRDKTIEMMGGFNQLTLSNAVKPVTVTVGVATENRFVDPVLRTQEEVASPSSTFKWVPVGFSEIQSGIESLGISLDDIAALNDEDPRLLQFVRNVLRFSPRKFAPINENDYVAVVNAQILAVISTFNVEHRHRSAELSEVDQHDETDSSSEVSNVAVQRLLQLILKAFRVARPYYVEEYSLSEEEYKRAFDKIVSETDENKNEEL